jgi:hypothetical protein
MQAIGDVVVVGAENPFSNRQRAHGGRFRFRIATLLAVQRCQAAQTPGHVRVLGAEGAFAPGERTLVHRFGFGVAALLGSSQGF